MTTTTRTRVLYDAMEQPREVWQLSNWPDFLWCDSNQNYHCIGIDVFETIFDAQRSANDTNAGVRLDTRVEHLVQMLNSLTAIFSISGQETLRLHVYDASKKWRSLGIDHDDWRWVEIEEE